MTEKERRKHNRINSVNLLSFIYFDENLKQESQGMGRTLNISETGLLLESNSYFDLKRQISINVGLENKIISVDGTIVFTNRDESGMTKSGISFKDINQDELGLLKNYICTYHACTVDG